MFQRLPRLSTLLFVLGLTHLGAPVTMAQSIEALDAPFERIGWEGVGRLDFGTGFCTGTLIARDVVLTAAHCVSDHIEAGKALPRKLVFRAGYHNGTASAERRIVSAHVPKEFVRHPGAKATSQTIPHDIALLRLESEIFVTSASPFRIHNHGTRGREVMLVSYGAGREEVLTQEKGCKITNRFADGILQFNCAATFGSSGAPVFIEENGNRRILSIISGGHREDDGRYVVYGMELATSVTELTAQLKAQKSLPPTTQGALRLRVGAPDSKSLQERMSSGASGAQSGFKRVRVMPASRD